MALALLAVRHAPSIEGLHRTRHLYMRQQTSVINAIHAHLAEFGAPVGRRDVEELLNVIANANDRQVPENNLKSAKALGLTLPSGLLSIVDEVIE